MSNDTKPAEDQPQMVTLDDAVNALKLAIERRFKATKRIDLLENDCTLALVFAHLQGLSQLLIAKKVLTQEDVVGMLCNVFIKAAVEVESINSKPNIIVPH